MASSPASGLRMIDVHCHVMPASLPACPCGGPADRWPRVELHDALEATLMLGSKPFRKVDNRSWDAARRIADMDADGVDIQLLSPMPELLSYWFEADQADLMCERVNATIAELVAIAPHRFRGLGMVPMQDPDRATSRLADLKQRFGLSGVEIGSNVNGAELGDSRFDSFFAAAQELDLAVFIHALHPIATSKTSMPPTGVPLVGFPVDTAISAASLLYAGTLLRYPRLRLGFSHGGGAFGPILHRLNHGWSISDGFEGAMPVSPREQAANLFFDSLVYNDAYLRHLVENVAPGRIFIGTDYPYVLMQKSPGDFLTSCAFDPSVTQSIAHGAAAEFIRL